MINKFYDKDGVEITLEKWSDLLNIKSYQIVEQTYLLDDMLRVSTVWLGIDHSFGAEGPPIIFETIVFNAGHEELSTFTKRYSTLKEAKKGHKDTVKEISPSFYSLWS